MRTIRGCLAQIGCLTVVVLLAAGAWMFRDEIGGWWDRWWDRIEDASGGGGASEELAREAERELNRLRGVEEPVTVRLDAAEAQSLLTYRIAPGLPSGVEDPRVEFRDSTVVLTADLRLDSLENSALADLLRAFVSDSGHVTAELVPEVVRPGEGRWTVTGLQAGSMVIPSVAIPWVLGALDIPGTHASGRSLYVPLSPDVTAVRVERGGLVIEAAPGGRALSRVPMIPDPFIS